MNTQSHIEAAVYRKMARFVKEYMGREPKAIHAHLIGDLLLVRLLGVLSTAEQHLVKSLPSEKGRELLKKVRTQVIETARPVLETLIQETTGLMPVSLYHDISTTTGEEIVLFTFAETPHFHSAH